MPRWADVEAAAPGLAASARTYLEAHAHKTIATLRKDGSPRISGTEAYLLDGELWFGSMPGALKARDLQRDPRFALHSGSDDPPGWKGDAKLAGRAVELTDAERKRALLGPDHPIEAHVFVADITELSVVRLNAAGDGLELEVWTPDRGVRRLHRT
jgi:hypothetical protein